MKQIIHTNNPIHPKREIVGDDAAQMRSQRVAHTGEVVGPQASSAQGPQGVGHTARHGPQVVHGRHVARRLAQCAPVQHEYVVAAAAEVRWNNSWLGYFLRYFCYVVCV